MTHGFDVNLLNVIYAEDEFVFREIATPAILKTGIPEDQVHHAMDGVEALEHLVSLQGKVKTAILMMLDVRMPTMDGNQCAKRVQEMVQEGKLKDEPFVICCSAGIREVAFDDPSGCFHMVMPKTFGEKEIGLCLQSAYKWYSERGGGSKSGPARGEYPPCEDAKNMDLIVADDEPICKMAVIASVANKGPDNAVEAEDEEELVAALQSFQDTPHSRPLIVFIGNPNWLAAVEAMKLTRKPFLVCTSVNSDKQSEGFHYALPRIFSQADMGTVLSMCLDWWNKGL